MLWCQQGTWLHCASTSVERTRVGRLVLLDVNATQSELDHNSNDHNIQLYITSYQQVSTSTRRCVM